MYVRKAGGMMFLDWGVKTHRQNNPIISSII
jgi:hypothetical protein